MKKKYLMKSAFSLMEMMVVLLIVAIVAAASAPMVTKKLSSGGSVISGGSGNNPWTYIDKKSIIFNSGGDADQHVFIGEKDNDKNNTLTYGRLNIDSKDNIPHLTLTTNKANPVSIIADTTKHRFALARTSEGGTIPYGSVAMGDGLNLNSTNGTNVVAIGFGAEVGASSVAVGYGAKPSSQYAVAIGKGAEATAQYAVAIGHGAKTDTSNGVNINNRIVYNGNNGSIAIGKNASARKNAVAIGDEIVALDNGVNIMNQFRYSSDGSVKAGDALNYNGANKTFTVGNSTIKYEDKNKNKVLTLGSDSDTVYIPGNLVVDGTVVLGNKKNHFKGVFIRETKDTDYIWGVQERNDSTHDLYVTGPGNGTFKVGPFTLSSDRRLKNVGEKFTGGLEELKKLDLYHFTFKKDEKKTPHVGVMAQDLQKVFPNAVTKGDDGYLRIRWDEMFYAVINAVKELDNKIAGLVEKVKSNTDEITSLKTTVKEQQKVITELKEQNKAFEKQNAEIMKRLEKLEKKSF